MPMCVGSGGCRLSHQSTPILAALRPELVTPRPARHPTAMAKKALRRRANLALLLAAAAGAQASLCVHAPLGTPMGLHLCCGNSLRGCSALAAELSFWTDHNLFYGRQDWGLAGWPVLC